LFLLSARDNYNDFSEFMWALSMEANTVVYETFPVLFEDTIGAVQCHSAKRMQLQLFSIKAVYMMIFRCNTVVIGSDPLTWYSSSNDICTLFSTFPLAMSAFDGLRTEDKVSSTSQSNTDADFLNLLHLVVPIAYAILAFLPFPVIVAVMLREMRMLCRLIMATDDQFRADAARQICRARSGPKELHYEPITAAVSFFPYFGSFRWSSRHRRLRLPDGAADER
jgi:hypothetical protein